MVYWGEEGEVLKHEVVNGLLIINITISFSSVEVFVADWLPWSAEFKTGLGSIEAVVNATNLRSLSISSSMGSVSLDIEALELAQNCSISISTALGSVDLRVLVGPEVGCSIGAETGLGSVDKELTGFRVVREGVSYLHVRSVNYKSAEVFLSLELKTSLGSIDITARRA